MTAASLHPPEDARSPTRVAGAASKTLNGVPLVSDSHHMILQPGARQFVILMSATGTKTGRFNLWKYASTLPFHRLYLRVPTNDWYQRGVPGLGADLDETIESIRHLITGSGAEKVYTTGSSMGGYGALLFGLELDAAVLAFSPEIVLDLPFSRSAKMMPQGMERTVPDLREKLAETKRSVVIYTGEMDPVDLYCAAMIRDLPNVNIVTFRDDEHTVMRTLFQTGRLESTIMDFVKENPLEEIAEKGNALNIRGYPRSFYRGWLQFQNKKNDAAIELFKEALNAYPTSARANSFIAKLLLRKKEFDEARKFAAIAVALTPNYLDHRILFAHCLRMTGALDDAVYSHTKILETWPDAAQSHFDLGQIYTSQKKVSLAKTHFAEAVRLNPTNATYAHKLAELDKSLSMSK